MTSLHVKTNSHAIQGKSQGEITVSTFHREPLKKRKEKKNGDVVTMTSEETK